MTAGLVVPASPVSAAEAVAALPYPGEEPDAVDAVADRITAAILLLATLVDVMDGVRTALPHAWLGTAARAGSAEVERVRRALGDGIERLYRARSALFGGADGLRGVRVMVDQLRHDWRRDEGSVRALDHALSVTTDPAQHAVLADHRRAADVRRGLTVRGGQASLTRADDLTLSCRSALTATVSGALVFVPGRGVVPADLGTVLGTGTLVGNDHFRSGFAGPDADETRWAALGESARAFALATAGAFPPPVGGPAPLAAWWTSRSWTEQQAVLHADPRAIGSTDGLPVTARDQANRLALDGREGQIQAALDAGDPALAGVEIDPLDPGVFLGGAALARGVALGALHREKETIGLMRSELESPRSQPLYLLDADLTGRGRAVVSIGDPDTADHVATYVPGAASDVGGLGGELDRVQAWADGTAEFTARSTAGVVWLGYDSPRDVIEAAHDAYADAGAPALVAFQQGLRVAHQGAPSRNVVIGHSYGALTVAAASTGGNVLAADGLLLIAPVGLEVGSVTDLHLDGVPPEEVGDRVLSMLHRNDAIQASTVAHPGVPYNTAFGARVIVTGSYGDADDGLWRWDLTGITGAVDGVLDAVGAHGDYQQPGSVEQRMASAFLAGELRFGPR
ncbi:MAG: alpha/beta hydrolase [Nakamurella sp.]